MSKIQVNEIVNHFDTGAPDCPKGLTITGIVTATTADFSGNVSIGGTLTYEDVTNIDSVGIITAQSGIVIGTGTSIGNPENNELGLYTNSSERIRIDSSGRLLVGTSSARNNFFNNTSFSPSFQAEGTTNDAVMVSLTSSSSTLPFYLNLCRQLSGTIGGNTPMSAADQAIAYITFQGSDGTNFVEGAQIRCETDGTPGANNMPGRLVFTTTPNGSASPTERMRLNSSGILYINNSFGANHGVAIQDEDYGSGSYNGRVDLSRNGTGTDWAVRTFVGGNGRGGIQSTNTQTNFLANSDYRLKENVVDTINAIQKINRLRPVTFNFIGTPNQTYDGFIAHEVQEIIPTMVSGKKDEVNDNGDPEYQCIDHSKLTPLLTAALQEAIVKIETLEAKVAALEGN